MIQKRSQIDSALPPQIGPKIKVTEISETAKPVPKPSKGKLFKRLSLVFILLCCLAVGVLVAFLTSKAAPIFTDKSKSFAQQVGGLLSMGQAKLIGESQGQINVLLLGIGGENHDGGFLSDSILLVQINPEKKQAVATSLPRDLVLDYPGLKGRKINAALAEGYFKNKNFGEGMELARGAIGEVTGKNIPYAVVVDFQGFVKIIDALGGIDVQIEKTFTDCKYPDGKYGYLKPVTFEAGQENMDGSRALIYARSRHAAGVEGSDFARSKRQQQIMEATKKRALSSSILTSPTSLNKILDSVSKHVHTNLAPQEIWRLYSLTKNISTSSASLTPESGVICARTQESTGAYILDACPGRTRKDIQAFFDSVFAYAGVTSEKPRVLLAATNAFGPTARRITARLENAGATVVPLNFDTIKPTENLHYQVKKVPQTNDYLKNGLNSKEVALPPPGIKIDSEKYDIVLVLKDPSSEDATIINNQKRQVEIESQNDENEQPTTPAEPQPTATLTVDKEPTNDSSTNNSNP